MSHPFSIHPHAHADVIQLALVTRCGGRAYVGERWTGLADTSALVAYAGDRHGFQLKPLGRGASVMLLKLAVDVPGRPFPRLATGIEPATRLLEGVERLHRQAPLHGEEPSFWLAALCDVLLHWPRAGGGGALLGPMGDEDDAVRAALDLIEDNLDQPPSLEEMASAAHLSVRQFCRRFETAMGRTAHDYMAARRVERAKAMLFEPELPISTVAEQVGFASSATFSRWFRQRVGCSPGAFRSDPGVF
ncbi:MAG: AraC family transcriptional regulator [Planctomycetota bacterium]